MKTGNSFKLGKYKNNYIRNLSINMPNLSWVPQAFQIVSRAFKNFIWPSEELYEIRIYNTSFPIF